MNIGIFHIIYHAGLTVVIISKWKQHIGKVLCNNPQL
jgi:hypothetical protein